MSGMRIILQVLLCWCEHKLFLQSTSAFDGLQLSKWEEQNGAKGVLYSFITTLVMI